MEWRQGRDDLLSRRHTFDPRVSPRNIDGQISTGTCSSTGISPFPVTSQPQRRTQWHGRVEVWSPVIYFSLDPLKSIRLRNRSRRQTRCHLLVPKVGHIFKYQWRLRGGAIYKSNKNKVLYYVEIKCQLDAIDNFYWRFYCLLSMFRAPLCPSSGAREYYTDGCCLWYLVQSNKTCNKNHLLHLVGILFPHINFIPCPLTLIKMIRHMLLRIILSFDVIKTFSPLICFKNLFNF